MVILDIMRKISYILSMETILQAITITGAILLALTFVWAIIIIIKLIFEALN